MATARLTAPKAAYVTVRATSPEPRRQHRFNARRPGLSRRPNHRHNSFRALRALPFRLPASSAQNRTARGELRSGTPLRLTQRRLSGRSALCRTRRAPRKAAVIATRPPKAPSALRVEQVGKRSAGSNSGEQPTCRPSPPELRTIAGCWTGHHCHRLRSGQLRHRGVCRPRVRGHTLRIQQDSSTSSRSRQGIMTPGVAADKRVRNDR